MSKFKPVSGQIGIGGKLRRIDILVPRISFKKDEESPAEVLAAEDLAARPDILKQLIKDKSGVVKVYYAADDPAAPADAEAGTGDQAAITSLQQALAVEQEDKAQLLDQLTKADAANKDLQSKLDAAIQHGAELEQLLQTSETANADLKAQLDAANARIAELEKASA